MPANLNSETLTLYNGTAACFDKLAPGRDGGIHLGTREQALMRAGGRSARLFEVTIRPRKIRRSRDTGGNWASIIRSARSAGCDAVVYLNRYEGIPLEAIERAKAAGAEDLDRLSDGRFRKILPESCDSWIVFSPEDIQTIEEID